MIGLDPGSDFQTYKKLCSSSNKINSLGKPSNRWKDIYVNKAILGDGDADSDVRLVADITGTETNPELKYNVTEQRWQVSHDGIEFNTLRNIRISTESPNNEIGVDGDIWVVYSETLETQCSGPWKWFKFTIDPMELNAYVRLIYLSMEPNADPYYDSSSVATLATGTPFASSTYTDVWGSFPPDGVFDVESGVPWNSVDGDPSPWIAFRFNDPTEFSYLYIMTLVGTAGGIPAMTGGDVYVSNDSTDGVDGTWRLLRSGILDQSGIDNEVFLGVSLCTEDPVDIFFPDR